MGFICRFVELTDSQPSSVRRHNLMDILILALRGIVRRPDRSRYRSVCRSKTRFARRFLRLTNGVTSHDTFSRLDPDHFRACVQNFARVRETGSDVI